MTRDRPRQAELLPRLAMGDVVRQPGVVDERGRLMIPRRSAVIVQLNPGGSVVVESDGNDLRTFRRVPVQRAAVA